MAYTYEQLSEMNVAQLRDIAKGIDHEAVHGFSTMHKEKLIPALCTALGIEAHKHHTAAKGFNKASGKSGDSCAQETARRARPEGTPEGIPRDPSSDPSEEEQAAHDDRITPPPP